MKKLTLLALLSVFASYGFAQTPVSSTADVGARGGIGPAATPTVDLAADSQGATLDPFSLQSEVSLSTAGGTLDAFADAEATFASAAKGLVEIDAGWNIHTTVPYSAGLHQAATSKPVWTYTFTATEDSVFSLNWNITSKGDAFGLSRWNLSFDGPKGGAQLSKNSVFPDGNGSLTRDLLAGQTYTVGLINSANLAGSISGNVDASMTGNFNWEITPVPEPMTCLVLGGGFLALARRRNRA